MKRGLSFGFIGLGQCGGNIANAFAKSDYKVIAINTSSTDLDKLESISKNNKLLVNLGVQGAGKNPEIGQEVIEEKYEEILHFVEQVFSPNKNLKIFVCVGLGGGTGTGIVGLMLPILIERGFNVSLITTLPSKIESPKAQLVALNGFENISKVEGLGSILVIDNNKANFPFGIREKYKIINSNIATRLNNANKLTIKSSEMAFDAQDFLTLLNSTGCIIFTTTKIKDIKLLKQPEYLAQIVRAALSSSIFADCVIEEAQGCAILFQLPKEGCSLLTEEALLKLQRELDNPFEVFTGIYENEKYIKQGTLDIILSGLPYPIERLNSMQENLDKKSSSIQKKITNLQTQQFSSKSKDFLSKIGMKKQIKPIKNDSCSTLERLRKMKKEKK